jgi:YgiT-type zinc finger domain-containing protein
MKCIHCQGEMERKTEPFQIDRKGYHITLDAVPAWVCTQCGEASFEEVEALQSFLGTLDETIAQFALAFSHHRVATTHATLAKKANVGCVPRTAELST